MKLGEKGKPQVYFNKKWNPICGHFFWDDEIGARKFCNEMGYSKGSINEKKKGGDAERDHFKIGKCLEADEFPFCKGGCNEMEVGGKCKEDESKKCDKGNSVKFYVTCSGDYNATKAEESSCKGNYCQIKKSFSMAMKDRCIPA